MKGLNISMGEYSKRWRQFRQWNRIGMFAFFGFPITFVFIWIRFYTPFIFTLVMISWITFFYVFLRQRFFRCPRCDNRFSLKGGLWSTQSYKRNCVHCGLKLYQESENSDG